MLPVILIQVILVLLGCFCAPHAIFFASAKRNMGIENTITKRYQIDHRPYFDDYSSRNVTAIVGQTAEFSCHVKNLGNRTISWIRQRDLHILTSSVHTYTGDERFSASHPETTDEWILKISKLQPRDAGLYECQINTEPKLNLAFRLRVEAAQAIINPSDVHVKRGSTISLVCVVNVQSTTSSSVSWYHGTSLVDFDSPRGGISLETEKTENGTTSRLMMTQARMSDSGNYTCVPSNANPASVTVHVVYGEHPAAMQHGGTGPSGLLPTSSSLLVNLMLLLTLIITTLKYTGTILIS